MFWRIADIHATPLSLYYALFFKGIQFPAIQDHAGRLCHCKLSPSHLPKAFVRGDPARVLKNHSSHLHLVGFIASQMH